MHKPREKGTVLFNKIHWFDILKQDPFCLLTYALSVLTQNRF
jgi:hypothetical protein